MKKIPTLFKRSFQNHKVIGISDQVEEGLEWVLKGEGIATVKVDGSCCAIFDGALYKRYDAKKGKPIPEGAIKCQEEADPITGHLPCWVKCSEDNPSDKWFIVAFNELLACAPRIFHDNHTYEAIGPHFQGNPYHLERDILVCHGLHVMENCPRTFEGLKRVLKETPIEGIVFWKDNEPRCKIKRTDFGFEWPCEDAVHDMDFNCLSLPYID